MKKIVHDCSVVAEGGTSFQEVVQLTDDEINLLSAPLPAEYFIERNKSAAMDELKRSDLVAIRCIKAGVQFPQEWVNYVDALRASSANGEEMPVKPPYPEGT